jgi:hypothetical protein
VSDIHTKPNPWSRMFARVYFDFIIYGMIFNFLWNCIAPKHYFNPNIELLIYTVVGFLFFMLMEALLLSTWGKTPGKWLFRIALKNASNTKLNFTTAFKRTGAVWLKGFCFGIPPISWIATIIAYKKLKKNGITSWDQKYSTNISYQKLSKKRIVAIVFIFFIISGLPTRQPSLQLIETFQTILANRLVNTMWVTYTSTDDGFETKYPDIPTHERKEIGKLLVFSNHIFFSNSKVSPAEYSVRVYKGPDLQQFFKDENALHEHLTIQGKEYVIVHSQYVTFGEYEAFESLDEYDKFFMKSKIIFNGNDIYLISVAYGKNANDVEMAMPDQFINAFKFL